MWQDLIRDEEARLAALHRLDVLDTAPEKPFERIVQLVRKMIGVPMATVTLVDRDRQWFKARLGLSYTETPRDDSICTHTISNLSPLVIPDLAEDPRFADLPCVNGPEPIQAYLGIPLVSSDRHALGALCAMDRTPREFTGEQIEILSEFALLVVDWLEMRRMAQTDFLTGAMARRTFLDQIEREIARCRSSGSPAVLAIFDIDHFKAINDTHGHPVGDRVLKGLVRICQDELRDWDVLARIGGEEFAILLSDTDGASGMQLVEKLCRTIGQTTIGDTGLNVTASFGISAYETAITSPDEWTARADGALYRAKKDGRNRCHIARL